MDQKSLIKTKKVAVTVDKSHLIVIGERLYSQSLELIRELVSNAYDADATHIWITLAPYTLTIKDNGSGMDEGGLRQYFNIGSQEKKFNKKSPVFGRTRIGEFGIGKFAALSACDVFTISTQKGNFAAKLTFDRNLWEAFDEWEIPIHITKSNSMRGDGTTIVLENLKKELTLPDIERFIRERIPLQVSNFNVYLNEKQIEARIIPGKKFPIKRQTTYGEIRGEIIIPNFPQQADGKGVECYVNEVFIKRETFGFEYSQLGANKLMGKIHADFLKITSDRSRFITDNTQYSEFNRVMRQELNDIIKKLKKQVNLRAEKKADNILKDALSHIRKALKKNPEFAPETQAPVADKKPSNEERIESLLDQDTPADTAESSDNAVGDRHACPTDGDVDTQPTDQPKKQQDRSSKRVRVKTLTGKEVVARRMQIGSFSVVCRTEEFGENNAPVMWDSGVIFINRDHPLYKRFSKNIDSLTLLITKLIAQEIARLRMNTVEDAFYLQNQILTDAWG